MANNTIQLPGQMTEKNGLLYIRTTDEHYIHQSWLLEDGKVLFFESIPVNNPSNALNIFENLDQYVAAIKDVGWINDEDYLVKVNSKLTELGYPFC